MVSVKKGKTPKPIKMVIYGPEGIGKTTLAAQCPDPLFIDMEDGSGMYDVARVDPAPADWDELLNVIKEIAWTTPKLCKTIVIDTADWAEKKAIEDVVRKANSDNIKSIEDFGYGKGYTFVKERFTKLLRGLDECIEHGINVVVTAHAEMKKVELPDERGSFDHWGLKLTRQSAPLLKEWCDTLLFCNYKTDVEIENGKGHASGGKRVIYTDHKPYWDAKNRHGLPPMIPMSWEGIKPIFDSSEHEETELEKKLAAEGFALNEADPMIKGRMNKGDSREEAENWILENWETASGWMMTKRSV